MYKKSKRKKVDFNLASEVFEDASLTDSFQTKNSQKTFVPIESLITNPYQPRIKMDEGTIQELSISIEENGLLQPITVLNNNNDTYTIVFGHRRVAAYAMLNKYEIEANILSSLDNKNLIISPIVENLQRKNMEPLETAMALNRVLKMGIIKTQDDLSKSLGISQGRISKLLSILKLSDDVIKEISIKKYKDVTVLAALNKVSIENQLSIFNEIKILKRDEALKKINEYLDVNDIKIKRIIHANNSIKINTKGIPVEAKKEVLSYIHKIEAILKRESNG